MTAVLRFIALTAALILAPAASNGEALADSTSAAAGFGVPPAAVPPRSRTLARYAVAVSGHDLREVLTEFSAAMGLSPLISEVLPRRRVDARFEDETGAEILDALGRRYGFDWWLEGETLRVTDRSEKIARLISLEGVRIREIKAAMEALGVWEEKFPLANDGARIAFVSGPPAYVALVELIAADLAEKRALEAAAFAAGEAARAEERARQEQAYAARRAAEQAELERRRAEYESRRQEMINRVREAARLRALWEMRSPLVLRGGGGGSIR